MWQILTFPAVAGSSLAGSATYLNPWVVIYKYSTLIQLLTTWACSLTKLWAFTAGLLPPNIPCRRCYSSVTWLYFLNTYIDFRRKLVSVMLKPIQTFLVDIKLWIAHLKSFQQYPLVCRDAPSSPGSSAGIQRGRPSQSGQNLYNQSQGFSQSSHRCSSLDTHF